MWNIDMEFVIEYGLCISISKHGWEHKVRVLLFYQHKTCAQFEKVHDDCAQADDERASESERVCERERESIIKIAFHVANSARAAAAITKP